MARKKEEHQVEDFGVTDADTPALPDMVDAANQQFHNLQTIDKEYADNLPYDRHRLEVECITIRNTIGQGIFELGKRLILLKEHEGHGGFAESLDRIGIQPRSAQNFMKAAIKFGPKTKSISHLGITKLIALATEPDEEIDELIEGGTIAGKTLDDIDRMSVRELKSTLRKEREKTKQAAEAKNKLIQQKNDKIDEYELEAKQREQKQRTRDWKEEAREIQIETTNIGASALEAFERLDELRDVILNEDLLPDVSEQQLQAMAVVYYDIVNQLVAGVGNLMHACDEVFGGYKDQATPMLNFWDEQEGEA